MPAFATVGLVVGLVAMVAPAGCSDGASGAGDAGVTGADTRDAGVTGADIRDAGVTGADGGAMQQVCRQRCDYDIDIPVCERTGGGSEFCEEECLRAVEGSSVECAKCVADEGTYSGGCNDRECICTARFDRGDCPEVCSE